MKDSSGLGLLRKRSANAIYLPSFAYDLFLLRITPFTYIASFTAMSIAWAQKSDFSWFSVQLHLIILAVFSIIYVCVMAVIYLLVKSKDTVIVATNKGLEVRKENYSEAYDLDSIDKFEIARIGGYAMGTVVKQDLFLVNNTGDKVHIYSDEWYGTPKKAWANVATRLRQQTGKNVVITSYFEDFDGEVLDEEAANEKLKKQIQRKMGF
jgi:flagellar basal body-associated protein FliL